MADVCATATDLRTGLWTSAKDTAPLRQQLRDQLDTAADEVDAALTELAAMPAAPVDGGSTVVSQLGNELTDLRDAITSDHCSFSLRRGNERDERGPKVAHGFVDSRDQHVIVSRHVSFPTVRRSNPGLPLSGRWAEFTSHSR
jgi:hypothetical protein